VIVRVGDLPAEGLKLDLPLEIGPLSYEGGLDINVAGARLVVQVLPSRQGLVCAGSLAATAMVPCSRCLEPFAIPVEREFELSYLRTLSAEPASELQISRDDLDVSYLDENGALDITDVASEQIYLGLPMKPLCAPECKGLCFRCGANRNAESCGCR